MTSLKRVVSISQETHFRGVILVNFQGRRRSDYYIYSLSGLSGRWSCGTWGLRCGTRACEFQSMFSRKRYNTSVFRASAPRSCFLTPPEKCEKGPSKNHPIQRMCLKPVVLGRFCNLFLASSARGELRNGFPKKISIQPMCLKPMVSGCFCHNFAFQK